MLTRRIARGWMVRVRGRQAYDTDRALDKALREVVVVVRSAAQLAHRNSGRLELKQGCAAPAHSAEDGRAGN